MVLGSNSPLLHVYFVLKSILLLLGCVGSTWDVYGFGSVYKETSNNVFNWSSSKTRW